MTVHRLCRFDSLDDPGSAAFALPNPDDPEGLKIGIMVIRRGDEVFAYGNSCPHTGAPLDFRPGQFLDPDKRRIQCSLHGAQFAIDSGKCLSGPCRDQGLTPLVVEVSGGDVRVHWPAEA